MFGAIPARVHAEIHKSGAPVSLSCRALQSAANHHHHHHHVAHPGVQTQIASSRARACTLPHFRTPLNWIFLRVYVCRFVFVCAFSVCQECVVCSAASICIRSATVVVGSKQSDHAHAPTRTHKYIWITQHWRRCNARLVSLPWMVVVPK